MFKNCQVLILTPDQLIDELPPVLNVNIVCFFLLQELAKYEEMEHQVTLTEKGEIINDLHLFIYT